ncbi:hypothetical protein Vadar_002853 [Vaccinium darrowii]|uniref:Uncharacterized protein n=1 Tax=Vaccinium darrowii TaxID=229202 RepID=A0ACB7YIY3_9ERIC|nr:hypothetical protein Vadar_002853 [Vaccinium darrowii]
MLLLLNGICRIWCEWLGKNQDVDSCVVPEHDFAVVTFSYYYGLGKKGLLDDERYLLCSNPGEETEVSEDARKKSKKSFSDPEDISERERWDGRDGSRKRQRRQGVMVVLRELGDV